MKTFLKDGLSLNEFKLVNLFIVLFVFAGIGIYSYFKLGDVPANIASIINNLVMSIAGATVFLTYLDNKAKKTDGEM